MNIIGNFGISNRFCHMKHVGLNDRINSSSPFAMQQTTRSVLEPVPSSFANRDTVEISGQKSSVSSMIAKLKSVSVPEEISNGAKLSTEFTNSNVSETAKKLAGLMDENNEDIKMKAWWSMNEAQLAEHIGKIGKQMDEAFSAGSITQQEYDDLKQGLENYTEAISSIAERGSATRFVAKEHVQRMQSLVNDGATDEEIAQYAKDIRETLQSKIDKLIDERSTFDRSLLFDLIRRIRNGESFVSESAEQPRSHETSIGCDTNGYKPLVLSKYV